MTGASQPGGPDPLITLWVAVAVIVGTMVGIGVGAIAAWGGKADADAILAGGGAFAGAVTLEILIINTVRKH